MDITKSAEKRGGKTVEFCLALRKGANGKSKAPESGAERIMEMKALKKAMSVLVSLLMIFTFALPAFAADATYTITAPDTEHQYEIYQIFTGDLHEGVCCQQRP